MQITGSLQRLSLTLVGDYFRQKETNCGTIDGPGLYIYMMVQGSIDSGTQFAGTTGGETSHKRNSKNKKSQ